MLQQDWWWRQLLAPTRFCDPKVTLAFGSPLINAASHETVANGLFRRERATCVISTRRCANGGPSSPFGAPTHRERFMLTKITNTPREKVTARAANMGRHRPRGPNKRSTTCNSFGMAPLLLLAFALPSAHCSAPSTLESPPVPIKSPPGAQLFPNSVGINSLSNPAKVTSSVDVFRLPPPPPATPYELEQELQSATTWANKHDVIRAVASKQNEGPANYPFSARQLSSHSTRHAPLNQHQQLHYLFPPVSSPVSSRLASSRKHSVQDPTEGKVFLATTGGDTTTTTTTSPTIGGKALVGSDTVDNCTGGDAAADDDDGNQSANQSNPAGAGSSGIDQSYGQLVHGPASRRATLLETSKLAPLPAKDARAAPLESRISSQPAGSQLPRGAVAGGQHGTSSLDRHDDVDDDNDRAGENKRTSIAEITNSLRASSSSLSSFSYAVGQKHGNGVRLSQTASELGTAANTIGAPIDDEDGSGQRLKQANSTTTPRAMGQHRHRHQPLSGQLEARKTGQRRVERVTRSVSSSGNSVGSVPRHGEHRNIVNANLIGQLTGAGQRSARSMYQQHEHEHEDYKFSEYDDLFLSHDFRRLEPRSEQPSGHWSLSPEARVKRSSNGQQQQEQLEGPRRMVHDNEVAAPVADALTLDKAAQVRTIYFGGFFPWLADEPQIQSSHETGNQPHQRQRGRKLAGAAARSESHSPQAAADTGARQANEDGVARAADGAAPRTPKRVGNNKQQQQQRRNQDRSAPLLMGRSSLPSTPFTDNDGNQDINNQTRPRIESTSQHQQHQLQQLAASTTTGTQFTNSQTRHQLGKFISPAVRLALDHINTNQTILSAYKLEVVPRDTQCNATISLKQFFDMVYEEPKKMLLYGDACRVSTDPIAKASYFFDLIQISYADTDPIYTIENYPNFFRVVPSENALSLARIPFIRHFNWTRVGTIYQNLPRYSLPHSKLLTDLERFKIVIKQSVSLPGSVDGLQDRDLGDELRKLKEKDVRIILGNFDEEWALLLFCEAFRERMTGRKYQWLLTGFSESKLWHYYESKGSNCTRQELLVAMDGYIITDITPVTRSQHRTISGLMAHEYLDEYRRRAREMNISIGENKFYGYVYDGIWAIALALNRVDAWLRHYSRLAREGKVRLRPEVANISSLLDFEYHQPIWVELIREALEATRFEGVTGTVSFHKNERPGLITFSQFQAYRGMNEVIIGSYDALIDQLDLNVGFPIIWRGSLPPIDYTIQRITPFRINRTLFVIISIMALLGIVLACVFLFVNIKFRDQRYIKMSSPYLNNLIIIGCILTFTSVIILGLDSGLTSEYNFPYICNARAWVLMAGFTLAFGSMFSKTFRVHSIFTNIKLHKKVIKDYKLFMVVFILLTFDVCILIVWQYYDPFYRETNNGTSIQDPDNEDVIIVPEMEHCQSKRMTIFLSVIYVYKGLLMAFGCFLAWETRHVSIPALNDSKYIGLSVYNVVIMCVIGASLSFILRDQQDASFVIISIFIIFCSTTTLCLVFVPKVRMLIELKQNPRAGDHRVRATLKTFKKNYHDEALAANCRDIHGNLIGRGGYGMNLNDRIKLLAEENGKQRSSLKEKTFELEALTSKYRKIQSMVQAGQYLQAVNTSASPNALATMGGAATATCLAPGGGTSTQLHGLPSGARPGSISPAPLGASSSMLFTSGGPGGGGLTTVTNTTSNTNVTGGQATAGTLGAQTTTVLLASRSPTRERVSFSALHDGLSVGTGSRHNMAGGGGTLAGSDGGGLRSSPMMSSVTQITNTTTTSSSATNNNTDLTGDLSSARALISTATTSGSATSGLGCGRQCLKATPQLDQRRLDGGADLGERVQAISKQVAASKQQATTKSARFGDGASVKQPRRRTFTSQDDLDLFTVLSYGQVISSPPLGSSANEAANSKRRRLGQWLEGPFSMLVLRQTNCDGGGGGQQVAGTNQRRPTASHLQRFSSFRKQTSQQDSRGFSLAPATKATHHALNGGGGGRRARERLPRTLSMIEYLGLSDFELIARRHDKILRNRRRRTTMTTSCRQLSCCPSCSCCLMAAQHEQKQQFVTVGRGGCIRRMSNHHRHQHNNNNHHHHQQQQHMQMSDGNLGTMLSGDSSEPLNGGDSEDYLQTTSLISCSTCCSLASQTYASHSELYHYGDDDDDDDRVGDSQSTTSTRSSSVAGGRRGHGAGRLYAAGGDSSSRTISSSMSESSSAIVIAGTGGDRSYVLPDECQSEVVVLAGNRGSQSSSLLTLNQAGGSCHHVQHPHYSMHPVHDNDHEFCAAGDKSQATQAQHRHHRHHLSSEAISSSQSNSSTSHATQIVTAQSERRQSRPTTTTTATARRELQLGSLCTSGVLYGAPAMKDDANDAAAHVMLDSASEPRASTSGGEPTASTMSPLSQTTTTTNDDFNILVNEDNTRAPEGDIDDDHDDDHDQQATLSIKCDILEEL